MLLRKGVIYQKRSPNPFHSGVEGGGWFSFLSTRMLNHRTAEAGCPVRGTNQGRWAGETK